MSEDGEHPEMRTRVVPPAELQHYLPKYDAINRYERVIDNQIETLNNIDKKAEHLTRLLLVIIGVVVSAMKVAFNFGEVGNNVSVVFSSFIIGIGCLVVSLAYAIVTYLSSRYVSGPNRTLASDIANLRVSLELYSYVTLEAYASAMEVNKSVVEQNAGRFRNSLAAILIGTLFLTFSATMLLLGEKNTAIAWGGFGFVVLTATLVLWYLLSNRYVVRTGRDERSHAVTELLPTPDSDDSDTEESETDSR